MGATVKFDPASKVAVIPDLYLSGNTPPVHAIAKHITRKVARLRPGKWFVQLAHDGTGGYIGLHGDDKTIPFTIKGAGR